MTDQRAMMGVLGIALFLGWAGHGLSAAEKAPAEKESAENVTAETEQLGGPVTEGDHSFRHLRTPVIAAAPAQPSEPSQAADIILTQARIYTVNPRQPWAEALAIRGEKIVAVGDAQQIDGYRGPATQLIDAQGRLVLPGFTDCHVHFMSGSLGLTRAQLNDAKTLAEVQKVVKAYADAHPGKPWVLGRGWSYDVFGTSALPDKKWLDAAVPDRPTYLKSGDGHTAWLNSQALEQARIAGQTPNPPDGA